MKKVIIIVCISLVILIAIISNISDNELDGKTIAFLGDSLMSGQGNSDRSFEYYFQNLVPNSKLINNSKSGATIASNTGTGNMIILNQAKSLKGNPDIIVIEGGANDIIVYGLGFLSNDVKKEIGIVNKEGKSDSNTVIGDFEEIITTLKNKFPDSKICYLNMFLIDDATIDKITLDESKKPEMKERRDTLYSQIKEVCKKMNVSYIDVTNKFVGTETKYRQNDYIHLKEEGYQMITPYILENLEEL